MKTIGPISRRVRSPSLTGERPSASDDRDRVLRRCEAVIAPIFEADLEPNAYGSDGAQRETPSNGCSVSRHGYTDVVEPIDSTSTPSLPITDAVGVGRLVRQEHLEMIKMCLRAPSRNRQDGGSTPGGKRHKKARAGGVISPLGPPVLNPLKPGG